jgi:hypothetical protein
MNSGFRLAFFNMESVFVSGTRDSHIAIHAEVTAPEDLKPKRLPSLKGI